MVLSLDSQHFFAIALLGEGSSVPAASMNKKKKSPNECEGPNSRICVFLVRKTRPKSHS